MKEDKKEYPRCVRCGRILKNPENRDRGMGEVCWMKYKNKKGTRKLF